MLKKNCNLPSIHSVSGIKERNNNLSHASQKSYLAIFLVVIAMFTYTNANALLKLSDEAYHPIQVLFFRFSLALIPCYILGKGAVFKDRSVSLKIYALRGAASVISLGCLFGSIYLLPFADATVLMFLMSLFMVTLSGFMLKEYATFTQWIAVITGFMGIFIMANPTGDFNMGGIALGTVSAFIEALLALNSRQLTRRDSSVAIVFYSTLFSTIISSGLLPFFWQRPTPKDTIFLILLGIGGGIAQYLQTLAYRYAPMGILGPIVYTSMLWAVLYGIYIFDEPLTLTSLIGGGIIIIGGLGVLYEEKRKLKKG